MNDLEFTKKRALRILGNRNYSEQEMHKRLVDKGEAEENAAETVRWLVELGYIDDSNYATLIVSHYTQKGYGVSRVKEELFKRGIPREMWDEKLAVLNDSQINDAAFEFLSRKLRGSEDKDDLRRAKEALVRRGFSYDEARAAINRYLSEMI